MRQLAVLLVFSLIFIHLNLKGPIKLVEIEKKIEKNESQNCGFRSK